MRASKLRRWLSRSDCPPALEQVRRLFYKAYGNANFSRAVHSSEDEQHSSSGKYQALPPDLLPLLKQPDIRTTVLMARHKHSGTIFARLSTHMGNSLIHFYPGGNAAPPDFGVIKYVYSVNGVVHYAIQHLLPTSAVDPFLAYPDFPAVLRSAQLSGRLEVVKPHDVLCHFARWTMPSGDVVVLPLYKVMLQSLTLLLMLTTVLGLMYVFRLLPQCNIFQSYIPFRVP